jgi:hypothetical protein
MYPQYRYSHRSKICNEVANHADFLMVDRAFEAVQNGIKISTKKPRPWILKGEKRIFLDLNPAKIRKKF